MKSFACLITLIVLCFVGCRRDDGDAGVSANQPPSASAAAASSEVMSRVPAPVAAAFSKNHPRVSPSRVRVRLFPDGTTHYQIMYVDGAGQPQQANYYADGRQVP